MASGPISSWQIDGETVETVRDFIFLGSKITADGDCNHEIKSRLLLGRKAMTDLDNILKSRLITFLTKVHMIKATIFLTVMYGCERELDHKEGWTLKNWCLWTVVLEKTLESHLDCKEIQPVNPKGNQPWLFIGRSDAEAETPNLWPHDAKSRPIGKDPDAGRERLKAGGEGDDRGQDGCMASLTQWTWVWAHAGRRWMRGKHAVPQSMGSQRVRHDRAMEQQGDSGWKDSGPNSLPLVRWFIYYYDLS